MEDLEYGGSTISIDKVTEQFCKLWEQAGDVKYGDILGAIEEVQLTFDGKRDFDVSLLYLQDMLVATYKKWSKLNEALERYLLGLKEEGLL